MKTCTTHTTGMWGRWTHLPLVLQGILGVPHAAGLTAALLFVGFVGGCKEESPGIVNVCVPPMVIRTSPANGNTNVSLDRVITATFSTPMNLNSISEATFTVRQGPNSISGTVSYSASDTTALFVPLNNLGPGLTYTCTITTGAEDVAGTALANNYVWTFTTLGSPTVIRTSPANGETNVSLSRIIMATFSTPMNPNSISTTTFTVRQGVTPVSGTVSYSDTTALFVAQNGLGRNLTYTCTITTGAEDVAGTPLASNYVWTFTTVDSTPPPSVDLGTASRFGAMGGNAGITNQGTLTQVFGNLGTTAASTLVTGFHDGTAPPTNVFTETPLNIGAVRDTIYTATAPPGSVPGAVATQGLADAQTAFNFLAGLPPGPDPGAGELGGLTLAPGTYTSASGSFAITSVDLTLDAQGDPNARFVFQMGSSLTVGAAGPTGARSVILINGAQPKNVFWQVGSAATINGAGGGTMVGTIIASSGVTFSTAGNSAITTLEGRALSLVASVTMVNTIINVPLP